MAIKDPSLKRKIGLVVPVVNNLDGMTAMLKSIKDPVDMVYVQPNWIENVGVSQAWNKGIAACLSAGCTHILVANDDIIFGERTISILADRLDNGDRCVLASGRNNAMLEGSTPETIGNFRGDNESEHPDFSCFMVTRRYIDIVGWFDENFTPAYFEDNDAHRRINVSGHCAMSVGMAPIYHYGSVSRKKNIAGVNNHSFEKNRKYYMEKWGGLPGQEKFDKPFNKADLTVRDWSMR